MRRVLMAVGFLLVLAACAGEDSAASSTNGAVDVATPDPGAVSGLLAPDPVAITSAVAAGGLDSLTGDLRAQYRYTRVSNMP